MESFGSTHINSTPSDNGIQLAEVAALASSNKYYDDFASLLNVKDIIDDFVEIRRAQTLVRALDKANKRFTKFDLRSDYHDMRFFYADDKKFYISFINISDENALEIVGNSEFTCNPIYVSKSTFFKSVHSMQAFASSLSKKGHEDFVKSVLNSVKSIIPRGEHNYRYRILKDKEDIYYLRATITEKYYDYSDNITIFLGLIGLHNQIKKNGQRFYVQKASFNESYIRASFAKEENRYIEGVGEVKYVIEVSNDEIKREALKFVSAVTIVYGDDENKDELYIKPDDSEWELLSISHGTTPKTVSKKLLDLDKYLAQEEEIYSRMIAINDINDVNAVRHLVYATIEKSTTLKIVAKKSALLAELNFQIDTLYQLFDMLNKAAHLVDDVEGKEYLRFLFYDALIYRKNRRNEKGGADSAEK